MEQAKKKRTVLRIGFSKALNAFQALFDNAQSTNTDLNIAFCTLESKSTALDNYQETVIEELVVSATEAELQKEYDEADEYKHKFMTAKIKFTVRINSANSVQNSVAQVPSGSNSSDPSSVKLPSMEIVKFDGDIRYM